ncbi:Bifunctional purine biosynthesis protein PurH [Candidatus Norongarragalina meridionalis]|nr:Bifunctional purine biosynthesis protein PurH [Candidatus Norongarragalina meridionalis]
MIRRALISVHDKTGVVEFAKSLRGLGVEIISTGGTASLLREHNVPVTDVSQVTGFPEMLGGRVKTLHPNIHAGILHRRGNAEDESTIRKHGIKPIDIVAVNLYPFLHEPSLENIDIGGVALIRAAAKNWAGVAVIVRPEQYAAVIDELKANRGALNNSTRLKLAQQAFAVTSAYDAAIASYFGADQLLISTVKSQDLRYGENPHQKAALYGACVKSLAGKQLSYNNLLDASAALALAREFSEPCCVIVKHTNPCGVAIAPTPKRAYELALKTDALSAFGGIVAFNRRIDSSVAKAMEPQFVEVVMAPGFDKKALELFAKKKNLRVIDTTSLAKQKQCRQLRSVFSDALLVQEPDGIVLDEKKLAYPTKRKPTAKEMSAMRFAFAIAKHAKSNSIVFASDHQALGVGAGQTSRIDAANIAVEKAKRAGMKLKGSVMASDAFFPFPDCVELAAKVGATAIIQPGGSLRDADSIAACDRRKLAMVFTGIRHFRH